MSTTEAIMEKLNELTPEKREEILQLVNSWAAKPAGAMPYSFLDVALRQKLQGPKDWAANFEEYLRGERRNAL